MGKWQILYLRTRYRSKLGSFFWFGPIHVTIRRNLGCQPDGSPCTSINRVFDDEGRAGALDPLPPSARLQVSQRLRQVDLRLPDARVGRNGLLGIHVDQERGELGSDNLSEKHESKIWRHCKYRAGPGGLSLARIQLRRIGRVVRALDSHPGDHEFESMSGLHPRVGASLAWGYTLRPRPVVRLGDLHPL